MKRTWIAMVVLAGLAPALAAEGDQKPASKRATTLLGQLDKNGDGVVAADEVPEERRKLFERLVRNSDQDANGKLNLAELTAGLGPDDEEPSAEPAAKPDGAKPKGKKRAKLAAAGTAQPAGPALFIALDTNGDAALDADEIAAAAKTIAEFDGDGDGRVTMTELQAGRPQGNAKVAGKPARPRDPAAMLRRVMTRDTNSDGRISRDEAPEGLLKRFDKLDKNSDGQLESAELETAFKRAAMPAKSGKPAKKKKVTQPSAT